MTDEDLMNECANILINSKGLSLKDECNLKIAGRFAWERREMGGEKYWLFAYKFGTPIVPPGHCCHPKQLIKRGWKPKDKEKNEINITRWPDGNHFYATINGKDIQDNKGNVKWNTYEEAYLVCLEKLKDK